MFTSWCAADGAEAEVEVVEAGAEGAEVDEVEVEEGREMSWSSILPRSAKKVEARAPTYFDGVGVDGVGVDGVGVDVVDAVDVVDVVVDVVDVVEVDGRLVWRADKVGG